MCGQNEKESVLFREAKKLREILDGMISRFESGETGAALRNEVDELRKKVIELLKDMEDIRMEDIEEKMKKHASDAREKLDDVFGNIGTSLDELSQKAQGMFGGWFSKNTFSREEIKAIVMSEELGKEYFETMRRRNWSDQGIRESLDVLRQIILSRI